jgi:hypothetical protein
MCLRLLFAAPTLADTNVPRTHNFSCAYVFDAPMFCRRLGFCVRQYFVNANILSMPIICRCQCFVYTNVFVHFSGAFASAYILVCANNLLAPIL